MTGGDGTDVARQNGALTTTTSSENPQVIHHLASAKADYTKSSSTAESGRQPPQSSNKLSASSTNGTPSPQMPSRTTTSSRSAPRWSEEMRKILLYFQQKNAESIKKLALPVCIKCKKHADMACTEATCKWHQQHMCMACFDVHHERASIANQSHPRMISSVCPQCSLERLAFWCAECDLTFCGPCFDAIHSVPRVQKHRRMCLEGSGGSLLSKATWSQPFQANVQTEWRKAYEEPDSAVAVGKKRKRSEEEDVNEVIVVDGDSDGDESARLRSARLRATGAELPPATTQEPPAATENPSRVQEPTGSRGSDSPLSVTLAMDAAGRLQQAYPRASAMETMGFRPPPTATATNNLNHVGVGMTNGGFQVVTPTATTVPLPSAPPQPISVQPLSWNNSNSSNSTSNHTAPAPTPSMGITAHIPNPAVLAAISLVQNPLEEVFFEQYHKINTIVMNLERNTVQWNERVIRASYQDIQNARVLMAQLQDVQRRLEKARSNRDIAIVQLVVQVPAIIEHVKQLRMNHLSDIPQVQIAIHQQCFRLSEQINQTKSNLLVLNQQLAAHVQMQNAMNPEAFHAEVMRISSTIQQCELTLAQWRTERQNEIVRLVQYSTRIRELLKQQLQLLRHQRMQQQQQTSTTNATPAPPDQQQRIFPPTQAPQPSQAAPQPPSVAGG